MPSIFNPEPRIKRWHIAEAEIPRDLEHDGLGFRESEVEATPSVGLKIGKKELSLSEILRSTPVQIKVDGVRLEVGKNESEISVKENDPIGDAEKAGVEPSHFEALRRGFNRYHPFTSPRKTYGISPNATGGIKDQFTLRFASNPEREFLRLQAIKAVLIKLHASLLPG